MATQNQSKDYRGMLNSGKFSVEDTFIAVMGVTGAGKSTFIAKCCQEADEGIGHSLKSMTQEIKLYTFYLNKRKIHLIDTPGFDDTYRSDSDVLRDLAFWLSASYGRGFRLTGIIYLHPITHTRMSGAAFKNLRTFRKLCGKDSMSSVVLATTMWGNVSLKEGDDRETDLKNTAEFWGDMIREGSATFRHSDNHHSAMNIISHLLNKKTTTVLGLQVEMVDQHRSLDNTEAGREVDREMNAKREHFERELEATKQEMKEAIANNDKKHIEEVAREQEEFHRKIEAIQKGREDLKTSMEALIADKEKQHKLKLDEVGKKLLEQEAESARQMTEFNKFKESVRMQQEEEKQKAAAREQELDAAREQVERGEVESTVLLHGAILALKEAEDKRLASDEKWRKEAEAREREIRKAEFRRCELEQQQRQAMSYNNAMWQQQQLDYAYAQQAAMSTGTGFALSGGALAGMALMSGCSIM